MEIKGHQTTPINRKIEIQSSDTMLDKNNESLYYEIFVRNPKAEEGKTVFCRLKFQEGNETEMDINGITDKALLAVLVHRLETRLMNSDGNSKEGEAVLKQLEEILEG